MARGLLAGPPCWAGRREGSRKLRGSEEALMPEAWLVGERGGRRRRGPLAHSNERPTFLV